MPRFGVAPAATAAQVAEALSAWDLRPTAAIEQFGGAEINSHNFKVTTSRGVWLCKRAPVEAAPRLRQALALAAWLAPHDVAVPAPLPAQEGSPVQVRGESVWCVWPFVEGAFFHAGEAAVRSAGRAAGRLHRVLADAPADLWPATRWDYDFGGAVDLLEVAGQDRAGWDQAFGSAAAAGLDHRMDGLPELVGRLAAAVAGWGPGVRQPCHGDLHPHNILMDKDLVAAFVDVESLVVAPYPLACGFARYKLVRQAVSAGGNPVGLGRVFAEAVRSAWPSEYLGDDDLRVGALAEVVRRLLLVLRLHYLDGNSRWNHVLAVHLAGLDEIDALSS